MSPVSKEIGSEQKSTIAALGKMPGSEGNHGQTAKHRQYCVYEPCLCTHCERLMTKYEELQPKLVGTGINNEVCTTEWQTGALPHVTVTAFEWCNCQLQLHKVADGLLSDNSMCDVSADSCCHMQPGECSDCRCMHLLWISQY